MPAGVGLGRPRCVGKGVVWGAVLFFPNRNPLKNISSGGLMGESDDDLLSRTAVHYHWRGLVSRSCSGWEGVVPRRYVRQTVTCAARRVFAPNVKEEEVCWVFCCVIAFFRELPCLARL